MGSSAPTPLQGEGSKGESSGRLFIFHGRRREETVGRKRGRGRYSSNLNGSRNAIGTRSLNLGRLSEFKNSLEHILTS